MTIKEIRGLTHLTQQGFSEAFGIPKRTVEDWERGVRTPPAYLVELLEFAVRNGYKKI